MNNFPSYRTHKVNYWRKMQKIAINFSAIIELVLELVISNIDNKIGKATWKTFQVIVRTSKC